MNGKLLTAAVVLSACISSPSWAMYRCGKVYQDTPCAGNVPDTWVPPAKKPLFTEESLAPAPQRGRRAPPPESPFAAECSRWGVLAQGVAAKRASGVPIETQVAGLPIGRRAEATRVVESVYTRRGTPPEIRAAVEKDCVAEKQKAADEEAAAQAAQPAAEPAATPAPAKP